MRDVTLVWPGPKVICKASLEVECLSWWPHIFHLLQPMNKIPNTKKGLKDTQSEDLDTSLAL